MGENGRQAHGQRLFLRGEAGCTRAKSGSRPDRTIPISAAPSSTAPP